MVALLLLAIVAVSEVDAAQIVQRADNVRNPAESYAMQAQVESSDSDTLAVFDIAIHGNDKTLVKTLAPARDRGRNLLMLGEDMWAYIPNIDRAVRVSLAQKLSGQAANGDISRMRWSGDYDSQVEAEDEHTWTLLLTAKKKGLTYERVRVWIEKGTYRPQRAQFLSSSDKVLKTATYQGYKTLAGAVRPSEIVIEDGMPPEQRSRITILKMEPKALPASLFNQRSLK